jgi:hypothetical protein
MQQQAYYDLHAHTTASDGTLSPTELVRLAKDHELRALAVTDHDTVDGIAEARAEAEALGVELVPGVEISATFGSVAVHVLGLFIEYREPWLVEFFAEAAERRIDRVHEMVAKLGKLGIEIDAREVFARSSHGTVGRPHVAEVLLARGVASSLADVFARFLGDGCPAYVGYEKVSLEQALALIDRAGGIASLAHPYVFDNDGLIPEMVSRGLPGLEVYHRDHSLEQIAAYESIANEHSLLATGGSDFHRPYGPDGALESVEPLEPLEPLEPVRQLGCAYLTEDAFEQLRAAAR